MPKRAKRHSGTTTKAKKLSRAPLDSGPAHPFYNTNAWRGRNGLRKKHLAAHPFCVHCIAEGKPMMQCLPDEPFVDHKIPHKGDPKLFFDPTNLQTMCRSHHSSKTVREDGGLGYATT